MKRDEIFKFIENYLFNYTDNDIENITELSNLKYDLNLDSLDKLELMLELENEYKIGIDGELYNECETIDDIINYVIDLL